MGPTQSKRVFLHLKHKSLSRARLGDLGRLLGQRGYQVLAHKHSLYAFKGLTGRYAPILVHAALILTLFGTMSSTAGSWRGTILIPEQKDFLVLNHITPSTIFSPLPYGAKSSIFVNKFNIEYLDNGQVDQFYSDLSLVDLSGNELLRKKIFVNQPLRFGGITIYQTDWNMSAIVMTVKGSYIIKTETPVLLPVASLEGQSGFSTKVWGSFIPVEITEKPNIKKPRGISIVARDLLSVAIYDSEGKFVGVRRFGSNKPISVEGVELTFLNTLNSTGLELKADPALLIVYTGFGLLLVCSFLSSISFCQVWAMQEGPYLHVGGKNNRTPLEFTSEIERIFSEIPEYISR